MPTESATSDVADTAPIDEDAPAQNDCWNKIGISGDQTCPELKPFIHCRNCPVFATAARTFFERRAPEGYLAEWWCWLSAAHVRDSSEDGKEGGSNFGPRREHGASVLIFRLGVEWLAFPTHAVAEVTTCRPIHRVPHRTSAIFTGLVNMQGQVQLCVSLHGLLGVIARPTAPRLVVLSDREHGSLWAFITDEVFGVEYVMRSEWRSVPSTLANPAVGFSQAVLVWNGLTVNLLDEQRVFAVLGSVGQ